MYQTKIHQSCTLTAYIHLLIAINVVCSITILLIHFFGITSLKVRISWILSSSTTFQINNPRLVVYILEGTEQDILELCLSFAFAVRLFV